MKLLKEINLSNPSNLSLTNMQKGVLLSIKISATANQAYEITSGAENVIEAREVLENMGLITLSGKEVNLTQEGEEALISKNLIDDMGEVTEEGQKMLNEFSENKDEYLSMESFDLLKALFSTK